MHIRYLHLLLLTIILGVPSSEDLYAQDGELLYTYDVEKRIDSMGIKLSTPQAPKKLKIALSVRDGDMIYLSGNTPYLSSGEKFIGKVGADLTVEEGYQAARLTAINILSALKTEIGDLNKVEQIVKVLGMVNATPDFKKHHLVINGFSDLIYDIFGERGRHARSAVGMSSIPLGAACEIEMIVRVKE